MTDAPRTRTMPTTSEKQETERELLLLNIIQCIAGGLWLKTDRTEPLWITTRLLIEQAFDDMGASGAIAEFSEETVQDVYEYLSALFVDAETGGE